MLPGGERFMLLPLSVVEPVMKLIGEYEKTICGNFPNAARVS